MDDLTRSFPIINNRYQISATIATGGMAVIYKAQDLMLERLVALKILKKELSDDLSFQNRFRQEARASARLIHPNIVTTFDFGFDRERLFIVMEYVDGPELKQLISSGEKINITQALDLLKQACRGLEYAHQQGFVHCDIKPQNMLLTTNNVLKITDFGISRALDTVTREEQADVVWGSPMYISPEQAAGRAPSPATDIYSLGVVAYEMLTGRLPFEADDAAELARLHRMEMPPVLTKLNSRIPSELNLIILRCLEKEPTERFNSAQQLEEALGSVDFTKVGASESVTDKSSILHNEVQKESAPKKPDTAAIFLALLALVLGGGLIPFWLYVILSLNSINR